MKEDGIEYFIRNSKQIPILKKIISVTTKYMSEIISANDPFGFDKRQKGSMKRVKPTFSLSKTDNDIAFYYNGWRKNGLGYMEKDAVKKNVQWIDQYKILIPKAWGTGTTSTDILKPFIAEIPSCCTETYLVVGPFETKELAENALSYINTKFFHFMVSIKKITQNSMQDDYQFVPIQDFKESWTDEKLYKKYNLSEEEIGYINEMIRN